MSGGPVPARDPGLQPERTLLAWRRTTLASTVAAVLAMRATLRGGASATGIAVCALSFFLWLGFLAVAHRRIRTLGTAAGPPAPVLTPRHAAAAALLTVALAVCGAALVL
ncbi:DUF202 domain-containing protein [Streptomyces sp. HUCO-GS316]|uniref:DUF202 domain-containing protein n=1 Tax=Streptomyces sp. HUCO-GS316 TaxID=2692198 RepID=UPI00136A5DE6|nr:DUF202 domain-containing protein [Streptomyces sp. HUCO-GS316]MXM63570.1 DUF202 domain-containing protein [Streptomyces sp. HUCO-GS316]